MSNTSERIIAIAEPADYGTAIVGTINPRGAFVWSKQGAPTPYTRKPRREGSKREG